MTEQSKPKPKGLLSLAEREPWNFFPNERVRPVVKAWLDKFEAENDSSARQGSEELAYDPGSVGARAALSFRSGVSERTIYRILKGSEGKTKGTTSTIVPIDTVDRLFVAMECVGLFHVEPSTPGGTDGFADLYFHPGVFVEQDEAEFERREKRREYERSRRAEKAAYMRERRARTRVEVAA